VGGREAAGRQARMQAGRWQVGRHASRHAGRQASRQTCRGRETREHVQAGGQAGRLLPLTRVDRSNAAALTRASALTSYTYLRPTESWSLAGVPVLGAKVLGDRHSHITAAVGPALVLYNLRQSTSLIIIVVCKPALEFLAKRRLYWFR
jgi:hypothetical protein